MASRLELHEELCGILETKNVYFNPPESKKMNYPCIVYSRSGMDHKHANNRIYRNTNEYEVTVIDLNPDSEICDRLLAHFQMCSFNRRFTSDNLIHDVLKIYY